VEVGASVNTMRVIFDGIVRGARNSKLRESARLAGICFARSDL
jgi:hypothetical protein